MLWCQPVWSAEVTATGTPGVNGANGATGEPGQPGQPGEAGGDINQTLNTSDPTNKLTLTGGKGGDGGNGGDGFNPVGFNPDINGGFGAQGGAGGNATAHAETTSGAGVRTADAQATGGAGGHGGKGGDAHGNGDSGSGGFGRTGGIGAASATGAGASGGKSLFVGAIAIGGIGGDGNDPGDLDFNSTGLMGLEGSGGMGGAGVLLDVFGSSASGGDVFVTGGQIGGVGGMGRNGGAGADSILFTRVSGQTSGRLFLTQAAIGGQGGIGTSFNAGSAGNAQNTFISADANPLGGKVFVELGSEGGIGGMGVNQINGRDGGAAQLSALFQSSGDILFLGTALGGAGGDSVDGHAGHGGTVNILKSDAHSIGTGNLELTLDAIGGAGGNAAGLGNGGNGASVSMIDRWSNTIYATPALDPGSLIARQKSTGGAGGASLGGIVGGAGDAVSRIGDTPPGIEGSRLHLDISVESIGGMGGASGNPAASATAGGSADASVNVGNDRGVTTVSASATGGAGGQGDAGANSGNGGQAIADAEGRTNHSESPESFIDGNASASAMAIGGNGAEGHAGRNPGLGGDATATAKSSTLGDNHFVFVDSQAFGGSAGERFGSTFTADRPRGGHAWALAEGAALGNAAGKIEAFAHGGTGSFQESGVGSGGHGGDAVSESTATAANQFDVLIVNAESYGGFGGDARGSGFIAGNGGTATVTFAGGQSTSTGEVVVSARQVGGDGGWGWNGADGGNGADSFIDNKVAALSQGPATLSQIAIGGIGGSAEGDAGSAGLASSQFIGVANKPTLNIEAYGGEGGSGLLHSSGADGGDAAANLQLNSTGGTFGIARAEGGQGGSGGVGEPEDPNRQGGGGQGGAALAQAIANVSLAVGQITGIQALATAGNGGNAVGGGHSAGDGGAAQVLQAFAASSSFNEVGVVAIQTGGSGGTGFMGADGGHGASSFLNNVAQGSSGNFLQLQQFAYAGHGGYSFGGAAGNGGHAGSSLSGGVNPAGGESQILMTVFGGEGGGGDLNSNGGDGGNAFASADLLSANDIDLRAEVYAGSGGYADGAFGNGGNPGAAQLGTFSAKRTTHNGVVSVNARVFGGSGGAASGLGGGADGASVTLINKVDGDAPSGDLTLIQEANGGQGGSSSIAAPGAGGNAHSRLQVSKSVDMLSVVASAFAGGGGANFFSADPGQHGGNAFAHASADNLTGDSSAAAHASGGSGGFNNASSGDDSNSGAAFASALARAPMGDAHAVTTGSARGGIVRSFDTLTIVDAADSGFGALGESLTLVGQAYDPSLFSVQPIQAKALAVARPVNEQVALALTGNFRVASHISVVGQADAPSDSVLGYYEFSAAAHPQQMQGQSVFATIQSTLRIDLADLNAQSLILGMLDPRLNQHVDYQRFLVTANGQIVLDKEFDDLAETPAAYDDFVYDLTEDVDLNSPSLTLAIRLEVHFDTPGSLFKTSFLLAGTTLGSGLDPDTQLDNGDFNTLTDQPGDVPGWQSSSQAQPHQGGVPPPPVVFVQTDPESGNRFLRMKTGSYQDGPAVGALAETFVVDPENPILSFDFTLADVLEDLSGLGASLLTDRLLVSIQVGDDIFDLLSIDAQGATVDPSGDAPGQVVLSAPTDPMFDFNFAADLSQFSGQMISLLLRVFNEDDGFLFDPDFDNFKFSAALPTSIPEPSALILLLAGLAAVTSHRRHRK